MGLFVYSFDAKLLSKEYVDYIRGETAGCEHLRFGQYICNKYLDRGKTCASIFYEESDPIAFEKIYRELNRD